MADRILIVDDSALSRKRFLAKPLTAAGFEVVEASNGEEGLSKWLASVESGAAFDCIISDLLMPVMDGFQLLEALNENGCTAPIIVASADIQDSSQQKIREAGAAGFLNKPYKEEQLLEEVSRALESVAKG